MVIDVCRVFGKVLNVVVFFALTTPVTATAPVCTRLTVRSIAHETITFISLVS